MASWALVHSPWMSVGRVRLRWDLLARTLSQSKYRHRQDSSAISSPRRQWYPGGPIDQSVFEDISGDYTAVARESIAPQIPKSSNQSLAILVKEGKYEAADHIRVELLEMGVEIQPDYIYEEAAKSVFQWPNPQNHAAAFTNWFVLLPDARNSRPRTFHEIRDFLLSSPATNMPLIIQFGLTAASKGYASVVEKYIIPIVACFADPAVNVQFLSDFEREVAGYQAANLHTFSGSAAIHTLDHKLNPHTLAESPKLTGAYAIAG